MRIKKHPLYDGTTGVTYKSLHGYYTTKPQHLIFDRDLLPSPANYYSQQFSGLKIKSESVKVKCCFHDDNDASLCISMVQGHFKCFACGVKGGDVIAFHRLRYKLGFKEAVTELGGWRYA